MRLAAVVVNHRTPDDTAAAVRSLQRSDRLVDDCIVVDNGSGDSAAVALRARFAGVTVLETRSNLGFAGGANVGIRDALAREADAVFLLNSDAEVAPGALDRLVRALGGTPHAGIAGPVVRARTEPGRVLSAGIRFSPRTARMRECRHAPVDGVATAVDAVSGCAMLVSRETFARVGLLAEDYFFSFEDLDFCLRARAAGLATVLVPNAIVMHEGARSIGPRSAVRLYLATRNHLLLASRLAPRAGVRRIARDAVVLALNLAHAVLTSEAPKSVGVASVLRGARDHRRGRYGPPPAA